MKKAYVALAVIVSLCGFIQWNEAAAEPYVGLYFGHAFVDSNMEVDDNDPLGEYSADNGGTLNQGMLGLKFGYGIGENHRVELSLAASVYDDYYSQADEWLLGADYKYVFSTQTAIRPYIGIGGGIGSYEADDDVAAGNTHDGVYGQGSIGGLYKLGDKTELEFGYRARYIDWEDFTEQVAGGGSVSYDQNDWKHELMLGVNLHF